MSRGRDNPAGRRAVALASGALFGFGLALAGMTRTERVRGFLDFAGRWDPSLLFVMVGAIAVYAVGYRFAVGRASPVFARGLSLPTQRLVDGRLLGGAALFGVGWGLGGFCPGPGLASLVAGGAPVAGFVAAMLAGIVLVDRVAPQPDAAPDDEAPGVLTSDAE